MTRQVNDMLNDYARRMQSQGICLRAVHADITGMTAESDVKEQMKPQACEAHSDQTGSGGSGKGWRTSTASDEDAGRRRSTRWRNLYKMEVDQLKEYMGENRIRTR